MDPSGLRLGLVLGSLWLSACASAPTPTSEESVPCRISRTTQVESLLPGEHGDYFRQVRLRIAARWDPAGALRRAHPAGVALAESPSTELQLTVEKDGRLGVVEVSHASGVEALDREALRAVQEAAPFPAPPSGLLAEDGTLRFPFCFIVTTGGGRFDLDSPRHAPAGSPERRPRRPGP